MLYSVPKVGIHFSFLGYSSSASAHERVDCGFLSMSTGQGKSEQLEDCFSCKLSGSLIFAGVSGYLLHERSMVPKSNPPQRRFLLGFASLFGVMSVGRWFVSELPFLRDENE